jgi:hypothetical protein
MEIIVSMVDVNSEPLWTVNHSLTSTLFYWTGSCYLKKEKRKKNLKKLKILKIKKNWCKSLIFVFQYLNLQIFYNKLWFSVKQILDKTFDIVIGVNILVLLQSN